RAGRFFFEDAGHLRRMRSAEFIAAAKHHGWVVKRELFANHFWGALEWITALDRSVAKAVTSPQRARTTRSAAALMGWQLSLTGLQLARRIPGSPVERFLRDRTEAEWARRQEDPGGSEMYLLFEKRT